MLLKNPWDTEEITMEIWVFAKYIKEKEMMNTRTRYNEMGNIHLKENLWKQKKVGKRLVMEEREGTNYQYWEWEYH